MRIPFKSCITGLPLFQYGDKDNIVTILLAGQLVIKEKPMIIQSLNIVTLILLKKPMSKVKPSMKATILIYGVYWWKTSHLRALVFQPRIKASVILESEWQSSDLRFNQKYQQSGVNEFEFVKFLTPERLLALENMMLAFHSDFYVEPHTGMMCWLLNESPLDENNYLFQAITVTELAEKA
jgi:hypothetical protein